MITSDSLKERMEKLKNMPPPSIEEVMIQWEATEKYRREHTFDESRSFDGLLTRDNKGRMVMR